MGRPTKEEVKKREEAKKKVEELLGDTIVVDLKQATAVASKLDEIRNKPNSTGGNKWLEDELAKATERNTELEDQLLVAKEDYNKLLNSRGNGSEPVDSSALEVGIRTIFNDLRNNLEGNNSTRTKYTQANIKVLLGKFLQTFPFLTKK